MLPDEVLSTFSEELRNDPSLKDFNDVPSVAKGFVDIKKKIGAMVNLPGDGATDEDYKVYYDRIRPETPEKYQIERTKLQPGQLWSDDMEKRFRTSAHTYGLDQRQMQGMVNFHLGEMGLARGEHVKWKEEGEAALKELWGNKYPDKMRMVARAWEKRGNDAYKEYLEDTGVGNHPFILDLMADYGDQYITNEEGVERLKVVWADKFDQNLELVKRAFKQLGVEGGGEYTTEAWLGRHPEIATLFSRIGSQQQEDPNAGGGGQHLDTGVQAALDKIEAIKNDGCKGKPRAQKCAYHSGTDAGSREFDELYHQAHPELNKPARIEGAVG